MIRRDYILRMIEEFARRLAIIRESREQGRLDEARSSVDQQFDLMLGMTPMAAVRMSDVEWLACLARSGATLEVQDKALMAAALLAEASEVATAQGKPDEAAVYGQKALQLLLTFSRPVEPSELPAFVPRIDALVAALSVPRLPPATLALLMQHYERIGEFARAEDALHTMLDARPADPDLRRFATGFYERLLRCSDRELAAGNLPRNEVLEGLSGLQARLP